MSEEKTVSRHTRRDLLKIGGGAVASMAGLNLHAEDRPGQESSQEHPGSPQGKEPASKRPPNFVIFLTDGQRADEMSVAGNTILQTPHMDKIAKEGIRFENAFVTNALCAPSRASLLTGLYAAKHGVIDNKERAIREGVALVPDLLRQAGYEIVFLGKSHTKNAFRGMYWDYYLGYLGQADYFHCSMVEGINGKMGAERIYVGYVDDVVTKAGLEWLEGRQSDKPFCLFLWLYAPHRPFLRPRHLADLYNGVAIPKPDTFDDDLKGYPGKPSAFINADNKIGTFADMRTLESLAKDHYATVVAADDNLGRVLDHLTKTGQLDDTAVFVTSDHGFMLGEWHCLDKRVMHEPSIRIPLAIRYPAAIKPGSLSKKMVLELDIPSTILDLAGVHIPQAFQGRSLTPLFKSDEVSWRTEWLYQYYEYPGPHSVPKNRGIRTERYKLIEYYEQEPVEYEFYDLAKDPRELHNLHGSIQYEPLIDEMRLRMQLLRARNGLI
ncbi:MAG: sulfatase [Terriglobia bacterium]|jgi:arylsulfatase A-like enzyme